ncbi:hypothetical protein EVAR_69599_1 [Eumeta japonica]|uniref:Uncharacterized protein n=1 Tax=Eumeta variegata TaxID=151549 RepID=A0A4C2A3S2_EUMVA|nr:hypothetical protein EVAR_69599_1 [Eumeta japonica]
MAKFESRNMSRSRCKSGARSNHICRPAGDCVPAAGGGAAAAPTGRPSSYFGVASLGERAAGAARRTRGTPAPFAAFLTVLDPSDRGSLETEYPPFRKAGDAPIAPLGLRMSVGGGDRLLPSSKTAVTTAFSASSSAYRFRRRFFFSGSGVGSSHWGLRHWHMISNQKSLAATFLICVV